MAPLYLLTSSYEEDFHFLTSVFFPSCLGKSPGGFIGTDRVWFLFNEKFRKIPAGAYDQNVGNPRPIGF